ncbi:MAG TPA: ATP-binding protein [Pirellulales bacterium]|nr:ATP-binding protein [Pirellulales bacterium]
MSPTSYMNPFRPGAGHMPPYLAGRREETKEFLRLLEQDVVLENLVLTGLRGVGKTVLLEAFKPRAIEGRWLWVGTDLAEAASLSEDRICLRLLADLAVVTSSIVIDRRETRPAGFHRGRAIETRLTFEVLSGVFGGTPGLAVDKLKAVLELVWSCLQRRGARGVIFAYDEAQNLSDHAAKDQFPLSLLLDCFQSLQRRGVPNLLLMAGLPPLFAKLVQARTFAERMFRVVTLDRLDDHDCRDAILKPLLETRNRARFSRAVIEQVIVASGGYPYFVQFICRELYDAHLQRRPRSAAVPIDDILRKLDTDFFAGRWARATDRQRELLTVIAHVEGSDKEFTVQDVARKSAELLSRRFSPSHVSQIFGNLVNAGLLYKNRHGKYAFAVPLLGRFVLRQPA